MKWMGESGTVTDHLIDIKVFDHSAIITKIQDFIADECPEVYSIWCNRSTLLDEKGVRTKSWR